MPLDFMRIPLIAVVGWWLYDEPLDVFVFAGAGLIISGILWNLRSEARRPLRLAPVAAANRQRRELRISRFVAGSGACREPPGVPVHTLVTIPALDPRDCGAGSDLPA